MKYYGSRGRDRWQQTAKDVERRRAANGKMYTAKEFRDYYINAEGERGWVERWVAADTEKRWTERKRSSGSRHSWQWFEQSCGPDAHRYWREASGVIQDAITTQPSFRAVASVLSKFYSAAVNLPN
jgi:hypothetical protein